MEGKEIQICMHLYFYLHVYTYIRTYRNIHIYNIHIYNIYEYVYVFVCIYVNKRWAKANNILSDQSFAQAPPGGGLGWAGKENLMVQRKLLQKISPAFGRGGGEAGPHSGTPPRESWLAGSLPAPL
jgi:hypothetical protein